MLLIFFALAFLIINNPENNRYDATFFGGGGGGVFANFVYFVLRVGKKPTYHEKVVETLARNTNIYKLRGTTYSDQISRSNLAILLIKI